MKVRIITTTDGSHTLYNEALDETYHSRHGAILESMHVFIKNGLRYGLGGRPDQIFRVFELGFGTGLNATLTALEAAKLKKPIHYTTVEPDPVPEDIIGKLNYPDHIPGRDAQIIFGSVHHAEWNREYRIHDFFTLLKIRNKFEDYKTDKLFDIIFFDAFAPGKQPELWDIIVIEKFYNMLDQQGILVTYSAQGQFKRNLKSTGFRIETLPGPPGKKEMVRAIKDL